MSGARSCMMGWDYLFREVFAGKPDSPLTPLQNCVHCNQLCHPCFSLSVLDPLVLLLWLQCALTWWTSLVVTKFVLSHSKAEKKNLVLVLPKMKSEVFSSCLNKWQSGDLLLTEVTGCLELHISSEITGQNSYDVLWSSLAVNTTGQKEEGQPWHATTEFMTCTKSSQAGSHDSCSAEKPWV